MEYSLPVWAIDRPIAQDDFLRYDMYEPDIAGGDLLQMPPCDICLILTEYIWHNSRTATKVYGEILAID